jgi:hypothetical protein
MHRHLLFVFAGLAAIGVPLTAQTNQQRARIIGGGASDQGKCTIEVVVDGTADVEVRGENATLRNLNGQPAQWRRFECTGRMPVNPTDFRFAGVDGRGRQTLVRDPRNGGAAVIRIEDPQGGAQGYTFDLMWSGGNGSYSSGAGPYNDRNNRDYRDDRGSNNRQYSSDAVRNCEDAVRQQAYGRFNTRDVAIRTTNTQDNSRQRDSVTGTVSVRRDGRRDETYDFFCSVNMNSGRVQSTRIDPSQDGRNGQYGDRRR